MLTCDPTWALSSVSPKAATRKIQVFFKGGLASLKFLLLPGTLKVFVLQPGLLLNMFMLNHPLKKLGFLGGLLQVRLSQTSAIFCGTVQSTSMQETDWRKVFVLSKGGLCGVGILLCLDPGTVPQQVKPSRQPRKSKFFF